MGRIFLHYVEAETVHCCAACGAHLAAHDTIISKAFQGRHGRAYLFSDVVNISNGPTENRLLLTGLHVVADIYCNSCDTRLGWKYVEAFEESQKYKEGKFILEKAMIMKEEERKRVEAAALNDQLLELDQNFPRSTSEGEADHDDESAEEEEEEDEDEVEGGRDHGEGDSAEETGGDEGARVMMDTGGDDAGAGA